jgi:hypothetical protein
MNFDPTGGGSWWYYLAFVMFALVYKSLVSAGTRHNDALANAWFATMKPLLAKQFSKLSAYTYGPDSPKVDMLRVNSCKYQFYATGRIGCEGLLATLTMRTRSSPLLFALSLVSAYFGKARDELRIDLPIDTQSMGPLVFAVLRSKQMKRVVRAHRDLKSLCSTVVTNDDDEHALSPFYTVLADDARHSALLTPRVVAALRGGEAYFAGIHITDCDAASVEFAKIAHFQFFLPEADDMALLVEMHELIFNLVDTVAAVKYTGEQMAKAVAAREAADCARGKDVRG